MLPSSSDVQAWKPSERALMQQLGLVGRSNGRPDAPRGVIESFLYQCQRTGLDPLVRQIYCIEMGGKWSTLISIDGFRLIAEWSKEYEGQTQPEWAGPDGKWVDVWLSDEPPAAARIGVYRKGFREPLYAVATFDGYCPRDKNGVLRPTGQWATNSPNQLLKCAEMLVLRKAFPNDLSGLYGTEEMQQATVIEVKAEKPAQAQITVKATEFTESWVEDALAAPDVEALADIFHRAQAKGELNIAVDDDNTLDQFLRNLKAEMLAKEVKTPEVVDV